MNSKFRNIFLCFGILAVIIMLFSFDMKYDELWNNLKRAGAYLPLVLVLWLIIYFVNAASWFLIIKDGKRSPISFLKVYKFTISGFALNYVTPVGLMGGEPYRIMELTPYLGVERATSSVILFVMMHISSHFCFWLTSVFIYVLLFPVGWFMAIVLGLITTLCLLLIILFIKGYRHGMAVAFVRLCSKIPYLKKHAVHFADKHKDKLETIDQQIALMHKQRKSTFYGALSLEFVARVASCVEVWLIMNILTTDVSFVDCVLIVAFSSLLANLFFFMPMQLGGREGGFALAVGGLSLSGAYGVYTALITRVREMFWIVVGLALMKVGNKKKSNIDDSR
ncbi:lysylphosphatidylglycerol synthase transmembrane domain-containing protein [uncultured Bacteroides sp.]|uniref:lysylphosphatidylglycerol synthase transmembrane domain-containing protein n=1 Tax=uncultured Bacteroides sp. TaxID=162156 RepID=UPI002AABC4C4|nr:lysylphosphatidylglycerol synthase transmembrane domain-containing protein [uncultured Bacteroides sp.]